MQITLVSHASVFIDTSGIRIWTDPWLTGQAFNNSWTMLPPPAFTQDLYDTIDYIWISHEHPDHFSVPTLRAMPEAFKSRVTVLFQEYNSEKIFDAMRRWGFNNFRALPNRTWSRIGAVEFFAYQVGLLDCSLVIRDGTYMIVNINDCDLNGHDQAVLARIAPNPDVVLNQFSIAGYDITTDFPNVLRRVAADKLTRCIDLHQKLNAKTTVPFASFVYFSAIDNKFVNTYANSIHDTAVRFEKENCKIVVLYPGESWAVGMPHDNSASLSKYAEAQQDPDALHYDIPEPVGLEQLRESFHDFTATLRANYVRPVLYLLKPLVFDVTDLNQKIRLDFERDTFEPVAKTTPTDIRLYSQPLWFGFANPFGFETLAVSCRFLIENNYNGWRRLKVLCILLSKKVYLKFGRINLQTVQFIFRRLLTGIIGQLFAKRHRRVSLIKGHRDESTKSAP